MVSVKVLVGLTLVVLACITSLTSAMGCGLPCSQRVLSKCIRPTGCELAKRPCGCCPTCALKEGDLCGAWTSWCQKGLWCYSGMMRLGFERVPPELFQFRGICTKKPGYETHHKLNDPTNPTSVTHQGTTLPSGITYGKLNQRKTEAATTTTTTLPTTTTVTTTTTTKTTAPPGATTNSHAKTGTPASDTFIESGQFLLVPLSQLREPKRQELFARLFGKPLHEFKSLRLLVPSETISKE